MSPSDNVNIECDLSEVKMEELEQLSMPASSSRKVLGKIKYQEKTLGLISQLVVNNKNMAKSLQVANGVMSNFNKHIERLINWLYIILQFIYIFLKLVCQLHYMFRIECFY